jgi:putative peptidoglycan lipid II flippase
MRKTAVLLMLITFLSTMVGFVREIILSYYYGVSNVTDAYIISITIPQTIFAFVGAGIATCYIPMYSNIEKETNTLRADKYTSQIINILLILCTFIVVVSFIFSSSLVKLFASGFQGETLNLAVLFTKINIFAIFFSGLIFVFSAYLQTKNKFIITGLINIPLNLVVIISIILGKKLNVMYMSIGSTLAVAVQLVFLLPFVIKNGYKYSFNLEFKDNYIKKTMRLSMPVIFGVSAYQINELVNRTIASRVIVGGITSLSYASKINALIFAVFAVPVATAMYPLISKMVAENDISGLKKTVSNAMISVILIVLPATVGAMIFADPIVTLLFGRGEFNLGAITMTSNALFFFSIGMIAFAIRELLYRVFYSFQDTKTPLINAFLAIMTNIILNIILSKFLGVGGLALATSLSAIFATIFLLISLRKKIGPFGFKNIGFVTIKIVFASLFMGLLSKLSFEYLLTITNNSISLLATIFIGALTYCITLLLLKVEDVKIAFDTMKNKVKRIRNG